MSNRIKDILRNPALLFLTLGHREMFNWMSDERYLKIAFWARMHKKLNLDNPQTLSEKLQWLKLYNRQPIYTKLVDKYDVKNIVSNIIGEEYIIPTLGVWDKFEDINFDSLPNQFVLKCTHDSGGLIIVRDKSQLNIEKARKKIKKCLKHSFYWGMREWPYKDVKPRIIAEAYLEEESGDGLKDYKIFCFDGIPQFLYLSQGLENHQTASISFLNTDWTFAPFKRSDYKTFDKLPEKPQNYELMLEIAKKLSVGMPHVRVDLYNINGKIYFGELTFFTCSGMIPFEPTSWDEKLGSLINLPSK